MYRTTKKRNFFSGNNFSLLHHNIRSLSHNLNSLTDLLSSLNIKFSFIGISETWLSESSNSTVLRVISFFINIDKIELEVGLVSLFQTISSSSMGRTCLSVMLTL